MRTTALLVGGFLGWCVLWWAVIDPAVTTWELNRAERAAEARFVKRAGR